MASVARLHLVHSAGEPRPVGEDVPPIVAPLEPLAVRPGPARDRFWVAVAVSLLLHGGLIFAWAEWRSSEEAKADGGSEDVVVIEGSSIVLLDSMRSVGSAATDLPEAQWIDDAAAVSSERLAADATRVPVQTAALDAAAEVTVADDARPVTVADGRPGNAAATPMADDGATTPVDHARAVHDAAPTVTPEPRADEIVPAHPIRAEAAPVTPPAPEMSDASSTDRIAGMPPANIRSAPDGAAADAVSADRASDVHDAPVAAARPVPAEVVATPAPAEAEPGAGESATLPAPYAENSAPAGVRKAEHVAAAAADAPTRS